MTTPLPKKTRRGLRDWRQTTTTRFLSTIPPTTLQTWSTTLSLPFPSDLPLSLSLSLPKRYLTYEPLVLFPSGSLPSTPSTLLSLLSPDQKATLWTITLEELSKKTGMKLTHLAVNAGIPLHDSATAVPSSSSTNPTENIIRSPTGLRELYGDFGPREDPSFDDSLWVWTRQNTLWQTWAPRHTMFSRGNVVEKGRLLEFHQGGGSEMEEARVEGREMLRKEREAGYAVDMYAGIGYFVFSYAKMGFRVLGWELNLWSVEGLRRGAERNGWSVWVVSGAELSKNTVDVTSGGEQITVFVEDNCQAERRIRELREAGKPVPVVHVNGGLLPTSEPSWEESFRVTEGSPRAWLHLHENVGVADIERRGNEIEKRVNRWAREEQKGRRAVMEFTMKVKTFAPGVWHVVYDVMVEETANECISLYDI